MVAKSCHLEYWYEGKSDISTEIIILQMRRFFNK